MACGVLVRCLHSYLPPAPKTEQEEDEEKAYSKSKDGWSVYCYRDAAHHLERLQTCYNNVSCAEACADLLSNSIVHEHILMLIMKRHAVLPHWRLILHNVEKMLGCGGLNALSNDRCKQLGESEIEPIVIVVAASRLILMNEDLSLEVYKLYAQIVRGELLSSERLTTLVLEHLVCIPSREILDAEYQEARRDAGIGTSDAESDAEPDPECEIQ
jgi:hypothetical protein